MALLTLTCFTFNAFSDVTDGQNKSERRTSTVAIILQGPDAIEYIPESDDTSHVTDAAYVREAREYIRKQVMQYSSEFQNHEVVVIENLGVTFNLRRQTLARKINEALHDRPRIITHLLVINLNNSEITIGSPAQKQLQSLVAPETAITIFETSMLAQASQDKKNAVIESLAQGLGVNGERIQLVSPITPNTTEKIQPLVIPKYTAPPAKRDLVSAILDWLKARGIGCARSF